MLDFPKRDGVSGSDFFHFRQLQSPATYLRRSGLSEDACDTVFRNRTQPGRRVDAMFQTPENVRLSVLPAF